jgi:hypothetical protein
LPGDTKWLTSWFAEWMKTLCGRSRNRPEPTDAVRRLSTGKSCARRFNVPGSEASPKFWRPCPMSAGMQISNACRPAGEPPMYLTDTNVVSETHRGTRRIDGRAGHRSVFAADGEMRLSRSRPQLHRACGHDEVGDSERSFLNSTTSFAAPAGMRRFHLIHRGLPYMNATMVAAARQSKASTQLPPTAARMADVKAMPTMAHRAR